MAGLAAGVAASLCAVDETTYGVAPSLSAAKFMDFHNETMALTKTVAQSDGIHAGRLHGRAARRVVTNWAAAGAVTMDLPAQSMNLWLQRMVGSYGQANATLTQIGTTGVYQATHYPGALETHSFCMQKGVPAVDGTVEPVTYTGCKVADWDISVATGQIASLVLTVEARNELAGAMNGDALNGSLPSLQAYVGQPGGVFYFAEATLFTGGTPSTTSNVTSVSGAAAAGNVRSANVKYTTPLNLARYFLSKAGFRDEPLQNGLRTITGQFDIEWLSSEAMYNAFAADTATTLQLQFVGPIIGTSGTNHSLLTILVPNIHLDGAPADVAGLDIINQVVPYSGLDDDVNNPVQFSYQTVDTT